MKVRIEDFLIVSDERQYIVKEIKVYGEDSKYAGEEHYSVIGYFTSIITACEHVLELSIMKSNSKSLLEIINTVKRVKNLLHESLGKELKITRRKRKS